MARKSRKDVAAPEKSKVAAVKIWRAALYIRLSVEFNSKRGDSLETQRQIMEAYIALCPDIEIVEVYTDNGITGRTFEREAFQRMLRDVEAGKIDCIVVKDLSRLGRNTVDTGYYIEKYFPLHGVRFIAVNDQFDSTDPENNGNHLIVPLKNMINEAYAADISKKVRAQQHQAMRDGEFVGARPPYGYRKDPNNCHRLLVNEDTAPAVRQIFQWIADGIPLNVVVKLLNEADIPTPGYYHASCGLFSYDNKLAGSGVWQSRTVMKILADEVYTGDMVQGKTKTVGHRQIPADPKDWVVVRNTHAPLISRELFEQAQAVRAKATAKAKASAEKVPYTKNILRGRIFCGHCGRNLHRERNQQHHYYYHCIANQRIGKDVCSSKTFMREEALFDVILTIIRQETENVIGDNLRLQRCGGKLSEQKAEVEKEISKLRQETEKNRTFLFSLYNNFVKGVITKAEHSELRERYERKISEAVERVQQLQERQTTLEQQMERYATLADRLAAVKEDTALSALLVDQLIERITVNGPEDISVQFTFESGFERVMEVLADE